MHITPYQPADREAVIDLILGIQRDEFGFAITRADQPDLDDILGFYGGSGGFWCAWIDGELAGTIALKDLDDNGHGALRKMFVAKPFRGGEHAVARQLLEALLAHASASGLKDIWLGTTTAFAAAHRFYEKNGFTRVEPETLPPAFPRMALDTRFYRRSVAL